jgi:hypothetical protein
MLEKKDKFIISKKDFRKKKINHLIFLAKKDFIIDIPLFFMMPLHLKKLANWYSALQMAKSSQQNGKKKVCKTICATMKEWAKLVLPGFITTKKSKKWGIYIIF